MYQSKVCLVVVYVLVRMASDQYKGDVFDVTRKRDVYGKGASYNIFAGKDGSRGLGKSSLKVEDAVSDYSTLPDNEMKVLDDWHSFFTYVAESHLTLLYLAHVSLISCTFTFSQETLQYRWTCH
jgi:hypothetical protein